MLLIIELLFLIAGLWTMILGKIPAGLFRVLFGKGQYELPPTQARLFGLFLSSPLPASFMAAFLLGSLLGKNSLGYSVIFEFLYVVAIAATSIAIARKIRRLETSQAEDTASIASPSPRRIKGYGVRLLVMLGLVVLGFITLVSSFTLIMTIVSAVTFGARWTGNFWSDIFPFILVLSIIGIGLFGSFKLYRLLST